MEKVIAFQLSLFGRFINIQPNIEISGRIIQSMENDGFIPSTFELNSLDPELKTIKTETRLQMISTDKCWSVLFLEERIDINYNYQGGENFYKNVEDVMDKAQKICYDTFSSIKDTTGIRLAVNGKFLLENMSDEEKQIYIKRFTKIPNVIGDRKLSEWNIHFNAPIDIQYKGFHELCNYIIEMYDILGIDSERQTVSPRLIASIDINTNQHNKMNKYVYKDLLSFASSALSIMKDSLNELKEKLP